MTTINKVPASQEDIAIGVGPTVQQRGTDLVTVNQCELNWIFRTVDEIRALDVTKYTRVQLHTQGPTDQYWFDATSSAADNGTTVLQPTTLPPLGRWLFTANSADSAIPLVGTSVGRPVTGPIEFDAAGTNSSYIMQHTSGSFGDVWSIDGQKANSNIWFSPVTAEGVAQTFAFTANGNFILPSVEGSNTESWAIGSHELLGVPNTLLFVAQNASGQQTSHAIAFGTAPGFSFVMQPSGNFLLARQPIVTDDPLSAVTKGYVDGLIPPGGGEANTNSNQGAGAGLSMPKAGADLPLKTLVGGTDITLVEAADTITINSTASGGGGSFIPLSGTLPGEEISGNLDVLTGNLVNFEGTAGLTFGDSPQGYNISYSSLLQTFLLAPDTPAGVPIGVTIGIWDGATSRNFAFNNFGQLKLGISTVDLGDDNSALSLGWWKDEVVNAATVTFNGQLDVGGNITSLGEMSCVGNISTSLGKFTQTSSQGLNGDHLTRKDYVDGQFDSAVQLTGTQTVNGAKTFTSNLVTDAALFVSGTGSIINGTLNVQSTLGVAGDIDCASNNAYDLGNSTFRWRTLYTNNNPSVSDERLKCDIRDIDDVERAVAAKLPKLMKMYKLKQEVKDGGAQIRTGIMAQELIAAFADEGLDAHDYNMLHHDGEYYGVNYTDMLAFIIASK